MNEWVVAVSVDKIQTFLTQAFHSHIQERQSEDATLKEIINSSDQISRGFFETIKDNFPENAMNWLLRCSGVSVFTIKLPEKELEKRLNELFVQYYLNSQGNQLIRWIYFPKGGKNKICAIQEAKKGLKSPKQWNHIVERNREILFSFQKIGESDGKQPGYPAFREKQEFQSFVRDINALGEKERFRIAVIKADLDGMGAMFESISDYGTYQNISEILNREISLEGLEKAAGEFKMKGAWLFPLYVAGDDIFFAVSIENLKRGIDVCSMIMQTVNGKISVEKKLRLSVGVEITFNREPIRYYMDMVEKQLKNAKSQKIDTEIRDAVDMKISIGDLIFWDVNDENKEKIEGRGFLWRDFLKDLKFLERIRSEESGFRELLGTPNFFYTLLQDIENREVHENDIRYINHILYHLMPRYLKTGDESLAEAELSLNSWILRQLYRRNGDKIELVLKEETKLQFQRYLRLMILFSDERFQSPVGEQKRKDGEQNRKRKAHNFSGDMFWIPRKYLYENCLKEKSPELTDIFLGEVSNSSKSGYQWIKMETSLFFKLRETGKISVQKAADMIELKNPSTSQEKRKIQEANEKREKDGGLPSCKYFDKEKFCEIAESTGAWEEDFIDSLMLFYRYHELFMEYGKSANGGQRNGKSDKSTRKNARKPLHRGSSETV
ncbi:MAG TPA: hypothetical protein H9956_01435 [Candidatus Eisenbergiella pullicola]|nr:hypothetical protein [Candidatus Eisenbergiella pullicola]